MAVATSKDGIDFNGSPKVNVVVLVLVPKDQPSLYLQALSSLATICREKKSIEDVAKLSTPEEIWRFFDRGGAILPDYVCARDIMSTSIVKLKENDTLEKMTTLLQKNREE